MSTVTCYSRDWDVLENEVIAKYCDFVGFRKLGRTAECMVIYWKISFRGVDYLWDAELEILLSDKCFVHKFY